MDIVGVATRRLDDGSTEATLTVVFPRSEELDGSEIAKMKDILDGEYGGASKAQTEPAPAASTGSTRRRRGKAAEPAADAEPAATEPKRGRRSRKAAEETPAEQPAAEPTRRRRRSAEPAEPAGISDEELGKAASEAAAAITPAVVTQILKEDFGVESTADVPQDQRQKFLDTLKFEVTGEE